MDCAVFFVLLPSPPTQYRLKEDLQKTKQTTKTTKYTYAQTIIDTQKDIQKISTTSPLAPTEGRVARPERRWG